MKLHEVLEELIKDDRKIFVVDENSRYFLEEIFLIVLVKNKENNKVFKIFDDTHEESNEDVKEELLINELTKNYNYREINVEEFNYLFELDYDDRFPELTWHFKYYDEMLPKEVI